MAFTPSSHEGSLNGTSEVTIVSAPGAGVKRMVRALKVFNRDTTDKTVTVSIKVSGTDYPILKRTLSPDDHVYIDEGIFHVLDSTKSLVIVANAAPTTSQPTFATSWADYQ